MLIQKLLGNGTTVRSTCGKCHYDVYKEPIENDGSAAYKDIPNSTTLEPKQSENWPSVGFC